MRQEIALPTRILYAKLQTGQYTIYVNDSWCGTYDTRVTLEMGVDKALVRYTRRLSAIWRSKQ